jgi:enoyl-CoA hydratase/carnithine racemase
MKTITCVTNGAVETITLNRPEKLNALSDEMRSELYAEFRRANRDEAVRVVVLTGSGKGFCVGADLSSVNRDLQRDLTDTFHPLLREIRFGSKIFVCAVNGIAAGAGISLAVSCDVRFTARSVRFVTAFHRIGLAPDTGLSFILPRLIPPAAAFDMLLRGGEFTSEEAASWLLFSISEDPLIDALKVANEISSGPYKSFVKSKQLLNASLFGDLERFLKLEAEVQGELGRTSDFAEGCSAFAGKRRPEFKGR